MIQVGEDLPLGAKPQQHGLSLDNDRMNEFYGNFLAIKFVGASGQIHPAHASLAQQSQQLVGADARPCQRRLGILLASDFAYGIPREAEGLIGRCQQGFQLPSQVNVLTASSIEKCGTIAGLQLKRVVKQLLNFLPVPVARG
jgi:hypothetical protein